MPELWICFGNNFKIALNSNILKTLKNKICSKCMWPETWILFLALSNTYFLWAFGKSLRNSARPTILSSTLAFPAISPMLLTLVCHPRYHITHLTHAGTPHTSPTLACHPHRPHKHVTHASTPPTPPTPARIARHFSNSRKTYLIHIVSDTYVWIHVFQKQPGKAVLRHR